MTVFDVCDGESRQCRHYSNSPPAKVQVASNAVAARAKVDELAAQHAQLEGRAAETAARCDELCVQGDALGKDIAAATDLKHQVTALPRALLDGLYVLRPGVLEQAPRRAKGSVQLTNSLVQM